MSNNLYALKRQSDTTLIRYSAVSKWQNNSNKLMDFENLMLKYDLAMLLQLI